jgi:hypothetical protein
MQPIIEQEANKDSPPWSFEPGVTIHEFPRHIIQCINLLSPLETLQFDATWGFQVHIGLLLAALRDTEQTWKIGRLLVRTVDSVTEQMVARCEPDTLQRLRMDHGPGSDSFSTAKNRHPRLSVLCISVRDNIPGSHTIPAMTWALRDVAQSFKQLECLMIYDQLGTYMMDRFHAQETDTWEVSTYPPRARLKNRLILFFFFFFWAT